jgi:hypothetical protein
MRPEHKCVSYVTESQLWFILFRVKSRFLEVLRVNVDVGDKELPIAIQSFCWNTYSPKTMWLSHRPPVFPWWLQPARQTVTPECRSVCYSSTGISLKRLTSKLMSIQKQKSYRIQQLWVVARVLREVFRFTSKRARCVI